MRNTVKQKIRWFASLWSASEDPAVQAYRVHVRGLLIGWALTASAMLLVKRFPDGADLTMYQMLLNADLPWQQHGLAAIQLAAPLVMFWHLNGLWRWGARRTAQS